MPRTKPSTTPSTRARSSSTRAIIGLTCAALIPLAGGCSAKSLQEENALLLDENQSLRAELDQRNAALQSTQDDLRGSSREIADLRRQLDDAMSQPPPEAAPLTGFEGIAGVSSSVGAGEVTAIVEGDVLFDSGRTTLKGNAKAALDSIARVLNSTYAGRTVRIEGHTDGDPIRKSGHRTNYHLGFERAYAVREYLASKGVNASRLALASYGPDRPHSTKKQSRRVEVVVVLD